MNVDVVIPTHLRTDFLAEALDSVAKQTLQPQKIIVVSDVENSDAQALIKERAAAGAPVEYDFWIADDDIPASGRAPISRNLAIAQSRSDWIAILDDDDSWEADYLERATALAVEQNADAVVTHTYFDRETKEGGKAYSGNYSEHEFFIRNPGVNGSNVIFRRVSLWRIGGYNPAVLGSADKEVLIRLMRTQATVAVLPEKLAHHRMHSQNASTNPRRLLLSLQALKRAHASSIALRTRLRLFVKEMMLRYQIRKLQNGGE